MVEAVVVVLVGEEPSGLVMGVVKDVVMEIEVEGLMELSKVAFELQ